MADTGNLGARHSLDDQNTFNENALGTNQVPTAKPDTEFEFTDACDEWEYITGYKLLVVIAACTMAGFLMLLDTSIIATVSAHSRRTLPPCTEALGHT